MPGRPRTKARRDREIRSGKRYDRAAKAAILKRADEVGAAAVAREAGVAVGTLRTWRKRLSEEPIASLPEEFTVESEVAPPGTRAERLRARAEKTRRAQFRAEDRADALIGTSQAAESRNAMVSANGFAERASELEAAARSEELHEQQLSQSIGEMVVDLIERAFIAVDLLAPRDLLECLLRGEEPNGEVVNQAREHVRRGSRGEVRADVLAEFEAERLALPAPEVEPEEVVDAEIVATEAEGLSFTDLPPEVQQKYRLQPQLAVREHLNALRRAENNSRLPSSSPSRGRYDFSHPGLRNGD